MKTIFQPKNTKVGIDIGSHSVKMVGIVKSGGTSELVGTGYKEVKNLSASEISGAIKSLAAESGISAKYAAVSVAGPSVVVRFISMPKMNDAELRSAMKFEAEKFIPFNISDCIVDFQITDKTAKDNKIAITLAAVKKDQIDQKIKLISGAGFTVKVIDVDSFALANSFSANFESSEKEVTYALLNIGSKFANLAILCGGVICFARDIDIVGPAAGKQDTAGSSNGLLDEMKLSFRYHENQSGRTVDKLFVSGGGANSEEMAGVFQETFGMKPETWDPFKFLKGAPIDVGTSRGSFAVAIGLALR